MSCHESHEGPARVLAWAAALLLGLCLAALPAARAQEPVQEEAAAEVACADCHDEVDQARFEKSAHGSLACADCHAGAEEVPHPETVGQGACADCHGDAVEEYQASVHGTVGGETGQHWLQGCISCHGDLHGMPARDDPASPIHPRRLPQTCGQCHSNPEMAERFRLRLVKPVEAYMGSVHAGALADGKHGADCSSCHGSHSIFPAADARSSVNRQKVADTCGACHGDISKAFKTSIHGQALAAGVGESPACTDCHGEHRILSPKDERSPVYATNIPKLVCGSCHGNLRLSEKYGLDAEKVPAYEDSYHGLAGRAGSLSVAHCGSCHGIHDILPSSDPRSRIAKANLPRTCGHCHPGAGTTFAIGAVHVLPTQPQHAAVYWIRLIYLWVIGLTIGLMVVHNLLDLQRKARTPAALRTALENEPAAPRERMMLGFRIAHGLLAVSFVVLAYTGFALKFPEGWWAQPLLMWEEQFGVRGWLHRAAAVVMLATAVFHLVHVIVNRKARACVIAMVKLGPHDLRELKERFAWYLGRRAQPPHGVWVGYPEKAEYLAVVWGTLVMGVTGFVLWFENLTLRFLPTWVADVATTIHYYEAVLATLAILVWHFYAVFLDPLVYPMDPAWLTGRSAPGRSAERAGTE